MIFFVNPIESFLKKYVNTIVVLIEMIVNKLQSNQYLLDKIVQAILRINSDSLLEIICNKLEREDRKLCKNPAIMKLYQCLIAMYHVKAQYYPPFSWKMLNAKFPEYPSIEQFLKSDFITLKFETPEFKSIRTARKFANKYHGLGDGYSIYIEPIGSGKKSHVLITKTKEYSELKRDFAEYYLERVNQLRSRIYT